MAAATPELARTRAHATPDRAGTASSRPGQTLLVTAEQGLGDTLQFVRFAQPLAAARRARARQRQRAARPAARDARRASRSVFGPDDPLPAYDAHVPLLSLAGRARGRRGDDSRRGAVPRGRRRAARRSRARRSRRTRTTAESASPGRAAAHNANDRRRSMPLAALAPLFDVPGIAWFSLHRDEDERRSPRCRPRARSCGFRRATTSTAPRRSSPSSISSSASTPASRISPARSRRPVVDPAAVRAGLALAARARRQPVVSDGAALPAAARRRLGRRRARCRRRAAPSAPRTGVLPRSAGA